MRTISVRTQYPFAEAVERTKEALAKEGFGIITQIDMQSKLKEKLGEEIEEYLILGACNPPLASGALRAEPDIGVMLPCNVVVRTSNKRTYVSTADPEGMMGDDQRLAGFAKEAQDRLLRVLEQLEER